MVFTSIDHNKFVSLNYVPVKLVYYISPKVPLLGLVVGFMTCKAKEAEWSIHKLSAGVQLVLKLVILLGSLLSLVGDHVITPILYVPSLPPSGTHGCHFRE